MPQPPGFSTADAEEYWFIYRSTSLEGQHPGDPPYLQQEISLAKTALRRLTAMLRSTFHKKVIVLIDEYDVPLQKAKTGAYYPEMLNVIRGMFGNVFKTNDSLHLGVLARCLRISHESIFTGLNNFTVFSVFDTQYRDFIGFTEDETRQFLKEQGLKAYESDVLDWYDGYNFAGARMLCPWSVLNFCSKVRAIRIHSKVVPESYWANSSGNDIIDICMTGTNTDSSQRLQHLLDGGTEFIPFPEYTTYPEISAGSDFDPLLRMMLHTGYLTVVAVKDDRQVEVKIPNKEVLDCFKRKARSIFSTQNPAWSAKAEKLKSALLTGDAQNAECLINELLVSYVSVRDGSREDFYHGFCLAFSVR